MKDGNAKFYALQIGIRELPPVGIKEIKEEHVKNLLNALVAGVKPYIGEKSVWSSSTSVGHRNFGEEIKLLKLEYVFDSFQAVLEIIMVTTTHLKKNLLVVKHSLNCDEKFFLYNNEGIKIFFDNALFLIEKISNIIGKFCAENGDKTKTGLKEIAEHTVFSVAPVLLGTEKELKEIEKQFDEQEKKLDEVFFMKV